MDKHIDWSHVTHLFIGAFLCLLAVVLKKVVPHLPDWGWVLIGASGVVLVLMGLPKGMYAATATECIGCKGKK